MEQKIIVEISAGAKMILQYVGDDTYQYIEGGPTFTKDDARLFESYHNKAGERNEAGIEIYCRTIAVGIFGVIHRAISSGVASRESIMKLISDNIDELEQLQPIPGAPRKWEEPKDPYKVSGKN